MSLFGTSLRRGKRISRRTAALGAVLFSMLVPTAAHASATVVSLEFDDASRDQYAVRSLLASHGFHGTFYVNSGLVGTSTYYMTWSQLSALASDGNEIGGHTLTHRNLTQLSATDARNDVCTDRQNLLHRGFTPNSFAYPHGAANATVEGIVRDCGYTTGRGTGGIFSENGCSLCPYAETIPAKHRFYTRTPQNVTASTGFDALQRFVTRAEKNGGGWVQLVFHQICDFCDVYSTRLSTLQQLLDFLRGRPGTIVASVKEAAQYPTGLLPPRPPVFTGSPRKVRVNKRGRFRYRFLAQPEMRATIKFTTLRRVRVGGRRRRLKLAQKTYTAPSNGLIRVKGRISGTALQTLRRYRRFGVRVTVTVRHPQELRLRKIGKTRVTFLAPKRR